MVRFIQRTEENRQAIRDELAAGLQAPQAAVSPKYLYDTLGSRLFEAICELPEYYPTRTEAAVFDEHAAAIAKAIGVGATMIDLGAGNCAKAARLFPALQPSQYVPVDISVEFLRDAVNGLQRRFPQTDMLALGCDFSSTLDLPPSVRAERRLFFYPGSSIGNFSPQEALVFLKQLRRECGAQRNGESGILFGVDLVKEKALLDAAYDDALGVTAAFNLNLLLHVNRLLNADFNPRDWRHRGFFNTDLSRIEMRLEARSEVTVQWRHGHGHRRFRQGETIHTECSYKYTPSGFLSLLEEAGFGRARTWTDARGWFMVCHAQAL